MARDDVWTEKQITIVLYEYCQRPFGQFSGTKPFLKELGALINRTPGAIVRKVGNLASFDPQMRARGVGGLAHTSKLDKVVWDRYYGHWDQLAYDAEMLLAQLRNKELEESVKIDLSNLPTGLERKQEVKRRINQNFFREAVLSSYSYKCCITGISITPLLEACHISGWANDENNRTNPKNGLCMTQTFHHAYDKFLMAITPDYEIVLSEEIMGSAKNNATLSFLKELQGRQITLPEKFAPERDFLAQHFEAYRQHL